MITYTNNQNELYYDFKMIADIFRIHPSCLKRQLKKYRFTASDYVKYKNRHLYSQNAVVDFVVFLAGEQIKTATLKQVAVDKIKKQK